MCNSNLPQVIIKDDQCTMLSNEIISKQDMVTISCPQCTYENDLTSSICILCEYNFDSSTSNSISNKTASNIENDSLVAKRVLSFNCEGHSCHRCGVEFDALSIQSGSCSICNVGLKKPTPSKKTRGRCFHCNEEGHWQSKCPKLPDISIPAHTEQSDDNASTYFSSTCATQGIIELVFKSMSLETNNSEFHLCSPMTHISQIGLEGSTWSCGYRNIQMFCISLMQIPEYMNKLFNGAGEVPDIHGIQSWIEKAWNDGFDRMGRDQLGGSILGSLTWIGAGECAALLRYFGFRANVVNFTSGGQSSSSSAVPFELWDWLERYFKNGYGYGHNDININCSNSSASTATQSHTIEAPSSSYLPPLYFQHDGHSRTIVGYEKIPPARAKKTKIGKVTSSNEEKRNILIFDPSSNGKTIKHNLLQPGCNRWKQQLKRGLHTINRKDYQIVYVAEGIMTPEERQRSKVLSAESFV